MNDADAVGESLNRTRREYIEALILAAKRLSELDPDDELARLVEAKRDAMLAEGVAAQTWLKEHGG